MATPISAADLKIRFPEFAAIADGTIDVFVTNSIVIIGDGDNWPTPAAYQLAQGYLVAHDMTLAGYGQASLAQLKGLQGVTRFKADDLDISFSDEAAKSQLSSPIKSTHYGRQFVELRGRYFPAIAVA